MSLDIRLFFLLNNLAGQNKITYLSIIFFAEYLAYILVAIFLVYLFFSTYSRRKKQMLGLSAFASGLIARYAIGTPIRYLWNRPRPFVAFHVHQLLSENSYSFPSGHALFFFAFSTAVFFYNKKLGMFFYIATIFMTIARVASGVHYPSDILGGMILGTLCGWIVSKYINKAPQKQSLFAGR